MQFIQRLNYNPIAIPELVGLQNAAGVPSYFYVQNVPTSQTSVGLNKPAETENPIKVQILPMTHFAMENNTKTSDCFSFQGNLSQFYSGIKSNLDNNFTNTYITNGTVQSSLVNSKPQEVEIAKQFHCELMENNTADQSLTCNINHPAYKNNIVIPNDISVPGCKSDHMGMLK